MGPLIWTATGGSSAQGLGFRVGEYWHLITAKAPKIRVSFQGSKDVALFGLHMPCL